MSKKKRVSRRLKGYFVDKREVCPLCDKPSIKLSRFKYCDCFMIKVKSEVIDDKGRKVFVEKITSNLSHNEVRLEYEKRCRKTRKRKTRTIRSGYSRLKKRDFYNSREWRELRFEILLRDKRTCLCCGARGGENGVVLHVDHIKPLSKFWELRANKDNLQTLCEECNLGKSNKWDTDFRDETIKGT